MAPAEPDRTSWRSLLPDDDPLYVPPLGERPPICSTTTASPTATTTTTTTNTNTSSLAARSSIASMTSAVTALSLSSPDERRTSTPSSYASRASYASGMTQASRGSCTSQASGSCVPSSMPYIVDPATYSPALARAAPPNYASAAYAHHGAADKASTRSAPPMLNEASHTNFSPHLDPQHQRPSSLRSHPPPVGGGATPGFSSVPFLDPRPPPPETHLEILQDPGGGWSIRAHLPGFTSAGITVSVTRRHTLVIVADKWDEWGGHFERRIQFGPDADLRNARGQFDGDMLVIPVSLRTTHRSKSRPAPNPGPSKYIVAPETNSQPQPPTTPTSPLPEVFHTASPGTPALTPTSPHHQLGEQVQYEAELLASGLVVPPAPPFAAHGSGSSSHPASKSSELNLALNHSSGVVAAFPSPLGATTTTAADRSDSDSDGSTSHGTYQAATEARTKAPSRVPSKSRRTTADAHTTGAPPTTVAAPRA